MIRSAYLSALLFGVAVSARAQPAVTMERAFPGIAFSSPVFLTHSGDGTNRLFVVEQDGLIKVFPNSASATRNDVQVFLDLRDRVSRFHNEAGVLGLAFHPDYETNGSFYVNYTSGEPNRTVISRFQVDPIDPNRTDPDSETILLEIEQPFGNHNAGMMQFGPRDGYLYVSQGDGGDRREGRLYPPDSLGNGQNLGTLHSAILRIDVDHPADGKNYGIPPDNPFAGNAEGWREEIWAYGLRNPWRFSIDSTSGRLWVADVGAKAWEEVNLVEKGDNFGWSVMEGTDCFREPNCEADALKLPVVQHRHEGGCNSITGGYVYRGSRRPELEGAYLYGDYCHGVVRMLRYEEGVVTEQADLVDTSIEIASFGVDERGELFVVNHNGSLYRFAPSSPTAVEREAPVGFVLEQNYPNPFNPTTRIGYTLERAGRVELVIVDVLGRTVSTLVSSFQPAGLHHVVWDGTNDAGRTVAPGTYLYTLRSGTRSATRTMALLE